MRSSFVIINLLMFSLSITVAICWMKVLSWTKVYPVSEIRLHTFSSFMAWNYSLPNDITSCTFSISYIHIWLSMDQDPLTASLILIYVSLICTAVIWFFLPKHRIYWYKFCRSKSCNNTILNLETRLQLCHLACIFVSV